MERLILIETSTALCSVALAENGAIVAYRESSALKAHASLTAVFIQEVLQECGERVAGTASAMDGEAYAARTHLANWIAITNVYPDSAQAARKNFQNNTLLRSLQ